MLTNVNLDMIRYSSYLSYFWLNSIKDTLVTYKQLNLSPENCVSDY